jgi:hypothetical protein
MDRRRHLGGGGTYIGMFTSQVHRKSDKLTAFQESTTPRLCLEPDPHLARVANIAHRLTATTAPESLKRKTDALDAADDEREQQRRAKIMQFMNPRPNRSHAPRYIRQCS